VDLSSPILAPREVLPSLSPPAPLLTIVSYLY
jgi:hypothetical protein